MISKRLVIVPTISGDESAKAIIERLTNRCLPEREKTTGIKTEVQYVNTRMYMYANRGIKIELDAHIGGQDVFVISCPNSSNTLLPYQRGSDYQIAMSKESYRVENKKGLELESIPRTLDESQELYMLMSTLNAVHNAVRGGKITAVIPSFPAARQDRRMGRESLDLQMVAHMLELYTDQVLTIDIHNPSAALAFRKTHFDTLYARDRLVKHIQKHYMKEDPSHYIVVAPDAGALKNVEKFAKEMGVAVGNMAKSRNGPNIIDKLIYAGDPSSIKEKHIFIVDDIIDTGTTMERATEVLKELGARSVTIVATHGIFSNTYTDIILPDATSKFPSSNATNLILRQDKARSGAMDVSSTPEERELCAKLVIDKVIVTNSVPLNTELNRPWVDVAKVTNYFAKAIDRLHHGESLSELLEQRHE